jgi:hypothetical protein
MSNSASEKSQASLSRAKRQRAIAARKAADRKPRDLGAAAAPASADSAAPSTQSSDRLRSNSIAVAARLKAENETRFPRLKEIETHPLLDCFPLMKDDEFARLVWSIRKIGLVDPIVEDETGRIIGGRCRFLACEIADVEPRLAPPKDAIAA